MKKTNTEYNDILSMVTHDLKSPMTAVMGALDFLSLDDLSVKEKEQSIKQARKASKTVLKLVENILVMAKHEAGKILVEFEYVDDLSDRLKDIAQTFKYETKVKNINLKVTIPLNLPDVYWDCDAIHYHTLNNIISNAIKFTDVGGKIEFSVEAKDNNMIKIIIKDDGIGIEKNKRKTIFEKFDTHNNQKVFKGTGLGLYNAYHFIKEHGGTIKVTTGIDKKGTGFVILLPLNSKANN